MPATHSGVQFCSLTWPRLFGSGSESEKKQHTVAKKGSRKFDTIEETFDP